jgi:hypothetical protein
VSPPPRKGFDEDEVAVEAIVGLEPLALCRGTAFARRPPGWWKNDLCELGGRTAQHWTSIS